MSQENLKAAGRPGTTPAEIVPFGQAAEPVHRRRTQGTSRPQPRAVARASANEQSEGSDRGAELLGYDVADLIHAVLSHPDTPAEIHNAIVEELIGADVTHRSRLYVRAAVANLRGVEEE